MYACSHVLFLGMCFAYRPAMAQAPGRRKKPRAGRVSSGRRHGRVKASSISTVEAASQCRVSVNTIAQWIATGQLPARRARGGDYRIRVDDLRAFTKAQGIRTDLLEEDQGPLPTCWEFWSSLEQTGGCPAAAISCAKCPVYRSRAAVCYEVRPLLPGGTVRSPSCLDCIYYATVGGAERNEP